MVPCSLVQQWRPFRRRLTTRPLRSASPPTCTRAQLARQGRGASASTATQSPPAPGSPGSAARIVSPPSSSQPHGTTFAACPRVTTASTSEAPGVAFGVEHLRQPPWLAWVNPQPLDEPRGCGNRLTYGQDILPAGAYAARCRAVAAGPCLRRRFTGGKTSGMAGPPPGSCRRRYAVMVCFAAGRRVCVAAGDALGRGDVGSGRGLAPIAAISRPPGRRSVPSSRSLARSGEPASL